jgi:hypothetical protein
VRRSRTVLGVLALLVCAVPGAGCGSGGKKEFDRARPVQDPVVRRSAEEQIQRRVLADMRANANPVNGPPFRAEASCLTQTGRGSNYTLNCRATGFQRPRPVRHISGIPTSHKVASEWWSVRARTGKIVAVTRSRGRSIGQWMTADYDLLCGGGSSFSGDPACHWR